MAPPREIHPIELRMPRGCIPRRREPARRCRRLSAVGGGNPPRVLQRARPNEPIWAYGFLDAARVGRQSGARRRTLRRAPPGNEDRGRSSCVPRRVEDRERTRSSDVRDGHNVIDWFPGDHPSPMPDIIAHGPKKLGAPSRGCGSCHLPNGKGRPENAQPGGLPLRVHRSPAAGFRLGFRRSADWRKRTRRRWSTSPCR
jgi:hypothetical protein